MSREALKTEWETIKALRQPSDKARVEEFIAKLKARDVEKELASQAGGPGSDEKTPDWYQSKMKEAQQNMTAKMQSGIPYTDPEVQKCMTDMQKYQQEYIKMVSDPAFGQAVAKKKKEIEDKVKGERKWTEMMVGNAQRKLAMLSSSVAASGVQADVFEDLDTSVPGGLPPGWWVRVPYWMMNAKDINDEEDLPSSMEEPPEGWVSVLLEPAPTSAAPTYEEYNAATQRNIVRVAYSNPKFVFKVTIKNESSKPVQLGTLDLDWFTAFAYDNLGSGMNPWAGFTVKPEFQLSKTTLEPGANHVRYIGFADVPLGAYCFTADKLGQIYLTLRRRHTYMNEFRKTSHEPPPESSNVPTKVTVEFKVQEFRDGKTHDIGTGKSVKFIRIPAHSRVSTADNRVDFVTDRDLFVPLRLGKGRVRATCESTGEHGLVDASAVNRCDITHVEQVINPEPSYFEHEGPRKAPGTSKGPFEQWKLDKVGYGRLSATKDLAASALGTEKGFKLLDSDGFALLDVELADKATTVGISGSGGLIVAGWRRNLGGFDVGGKNLWSTELKKDIKGVVVSGDGERIFATCRDDDLHLLSKDGKVVWSKEISNADEPLVTNLAGDRVMVKTTSEYMYLDGSGSKLWKFDQSYYGEYPSSASMSDDGGLVAIGSDKNMYLFDGAGKELFKQTSAHVKSCAVAGDGSVSAFSDWGGNTVVVDKSGQVLARLQTQSGDRAVTI